MTWPQAAHLNDALTDVGDAKLVTRVLQWDFAQTFLDPLNLYQLNFFHPARYVLAFSENLYGVAVFGFPLLAGGASPLLNYNLLLLLGMFLSAISAWALAREITGDPIAAVLAGLVFAFLPWRFSQLAHLQFQWAGFLCLLLLFLLRYLQRGRRRDAVLFGVCFAWNALCNVHYAVFSGFLVGVTLALFTLQPGPARGRRLRGADGGRPGRAGRLSVHCCLTAKRREAAADATLHSARSRNSQGNGATFFPPAARTSSTARRRSAGAAPKGISSRAWCPWPLPWRRCGSRAGRFPHRARHAGFPRPPCGGARRGRWTCSPCCSQRRGCGRFAPSGLRLGSVSLGDSGRILVVLTLVVALRFVVAFPKWARSAHLADYLGASPLGPRGALFVCIGAVGVLIALGAHAIMHSCTSRSGDVPSDRAGTASSPGACRAGCVGTGPDGPGTRLAPPPCLDRRRGRHRDFRVPRVSPRPRADTGAGAGGLPLALDPRASMRGGRVAAWH